MAHIITGRKSGFITRDGRKRRETRWLAGLSTNTVAAAANNATLLTSLNAAALALRPFTVVRTRGFMYIRSDQNAASETYEMAYGEAVVSDQASAIGVTAVPTPTTDDGSDLWFVYERRGGEVAFSDATGIQSLQGIQPFAFDSKAMRKVEDGQDIVSVQESSALSAGAQLLVYSRSLIKLH